MPGGSPDEGGPEGPGRTAEERRLAEMEYASSNRNMAVGLGGTSVAILTFALFFLYNGYLSGEFDPWFFRVTVGVIVASLFLFSYSATYCYRLLEALERRDARAVALRRGADSTFLVGLILLTATPVLLLITARLWDLGLFALVLWVGQLALLVRGWVEWHGPGRAPRGQ